MPKCTRASRQVIQVGGGGMHMQKASSISESIAILKNRLQQGITIDLHTYVEVLKSCNVYSECL